MDNPCLILTVDPDHFLLEMIETGFGLFKPEWKILRAQDPEAARDLMHRHEVDAVITEVEFPSNGSVVGSEPGEKANRLLSELDSGFPEVPVFILTEAPAKEVQSLSNAEFIAKPPDMDYLIGKVHRAIQRSRGSVVRGISLESFLQLLELERKTSTLVVSAGKRSGRLFVRGGQLIHAETGRAKEQLQGKEAAFAILSWKEPSIEVLAECKAVPSISERLSALLLEWCVKKDHGLV